MAGKFDAIKPKSTTIEPDPTAFIEAGLQRVEPTPTSVARTQHAVPKKRLKKQKMIIMSDQTDQCLEHMIISLMRLHPEQHRQLNRSTLIAAALHAFAHLPTAQQIQALQQID